MTKSLNKSYKEARESLVYSLSELMFGSLLASYILGFIGISISASSNIIDNDVESYAIVFFSIIIFIFISLAFSYISAAIYIAYHATMLLMPQLPFERIRWDFLIALLHAVLFGLAMLFPVAFPSCIAGAVLIVEFRRGQEYEKFIEHLWGNHFKKDERSGSGSNQILNFKEILSSEISSGKGNVAKIFQLWLPKMKRTFCISVLIWVVNIAVYLIYKHYFPNPSPWSKGLLALLYGLFFIWVFRVAGRILKLGATLLDDINAADSSKENENRLDNYYNKMISKIEHQLVE